MATPDAIPHRRRHRWGYVLAFLVALALVAVPLVYGRLFPQPTKYEDDLAHFQFASVGVEPATGVPLLVWQALPGLCMPLEQRALGYRRFGFQWAPGRATPIGMPVETAIVPRVGINCALCHVGRVETTAGSRLVPGAPNTSLDLQGYLRFLYGCVGSPAFTPERVLAEGERLGYRLSSIETLAYRRLIIPQVKQAVAGQARQLGFMNAQPDWGPGRTTGFQAAKVQVLKRPFDGTLDIVDIPALWNLKARAGGYWHWDGANSSLHEVFLNSGIGNGASGRTIQIGNLDRMQRWAEALPPAPYPGSVDRMLADKGKAVFEGACAECHAPGGAKVNQVIPIGWVGTDRARLDALTPETVEGFKALTYKKWRYTHFRKTNGYVATTLDGVWARAPYLHNGSVPTLAALLRPPGERPVEFRRGSPRYDLERVGFESGVGRPYDTRLAGNGNGGHPWGTDLPREQKRALLEYLKTL